MRLIDADALMEHAMRDKLDSRELIAHMIDSAPTIEPKRGEWRYVGNSIELMWECPQCGYKVFGFERELPNFCGNCGCDMRKERASDE